MPLRAELRKLFLGGVVLQRCRPVTRAPEAVNRWVGRSGISQPIADEGVLLASLNKALEG